MPFLILLLCALFLSFDAIAFSPTNHQKISLKEKIGQMLLVGFEEKSIKAESPIVKAIEKYNLGGVILFDKGYRKKQFIRNIESPKQVKKLNEDLQHFTSFSNKKHHRPRLPLLISVDYEGGKVVRLKEQYGFPATFSATQVGKKNPLEAKRIAKSMTKTLKNSGFNLNFAPDLDLGINPNNPVIAKKERSFSSDPEIVSQYAGIYSTAFMNQKIHCAYKHFPGHGSSTKDSHLGFVDVTDTWSPIELEPWQHLLHSPKACQMVMTAHIVNRQLDKSGLPATLSRPILTGLLRNQLGFKGVIITDDLQMKAISEHYGLEQALVLAINAGADILTFGNNLSDEFQDPGQIIDIIEHKVSSGEIEEKRIHESWQRIVKFKQALMKE